jgi:flagellar biosynthesis/type III secretory pathway protein FliH
MSSLAKPSRVIRSAPSEDEVFVLGEPTRRTLPVHGPMATADEIIGGAHRQAAAILAEAHRQAAAITAQAASIREAGRAAGHADGHAAALLEADQLIGLLRAAATAGSAIRDQIAAEASGVITRAVLFAVRRIIGEYYEADPARTSAAVADAVRAASGQEVISIRVHPEAEAPVTAALVDVAAYVRPDESVDVGGCIIDLRNGTIDATLDTRLSLMELAIRASSGLEAP